MPRERYEITLTDGHAPLVRWVILDQWLHPHPSHDALQARLSRCRDAVLSSGQIEKLADQLWEQGAAVAQAAARVDIRIPHAERASPSLIDDSLTAEIDGLQSQVDGLREEKRRLAGELTQKEQEIRRLKGLEAQLRQELTRVAEDHAVSLASKNEEAAQIQARMTKQLQDCQTLNVRLNGEIARLGQELDASRAQQTTSSNRVQTATQLDEPGDI